MRKAIGAFLVALPFICIFSFFAYEGGFLKATATFAFAFTIAGVIYGGISLYMSDDNR